MSNADIDWSRTPLGPRETWSSALTTAAALVFAARIPMTLFWGPDFVCVTNAATSALDDRTIGAVAASSPSGWAGLEAAVRSVFEGAPDAAVDLWTGPTHFVSVTCSPVLDPSAPTGVGGVLACGMALPVPKPSKGRLRERTEQLQQTEEALRQAQKMAALGHLTGGVAHDFNNLLGAIVGSYELIRRKHNDPARVRALADAGLLVAERGARLTAQLLTFSRAQRLELTAVNVGEVVDGMRDLLRRTLDPRVAVKFDVSCGSSYVLSDRTQLEMALLNLTINARDAMQAGGRLTVAARLRTVDHDASLKSGAYVELLVKDIGIGMSADVIAHAFDPFFTTKEEGHGTGLGLSQVHGLARQAGGAVRIESAPGKGTTIRMLLPCTEAPPRVERPPQATLDPAPAPDATVLLVDDDQDLRTVLAASLEDLGYRVIEAVDGAQGLALLERHDPDLLVADFAMPGMTGAELARSARLRRPELPIIFATGLAERLDLPVTSGPPTRVLRKPFRISELEREIARALNAPA